MNEVSSYILWSIILVIIFILMRVLCTVMCKNMSAPARSRPNRRVVRRIRIDPAVTVRDRQGNIFTISDESSVNNGNRYADFFYLEASNNDAERIRAQREKDDKDLPSYEEVMGISNIPAVRTETPPSVVVAVANEMVTNELPAVPSPMATMSSTSSGTATAITIVTETATTAPAATTASTEALIMAAVNPSEPCTSRAAGTEAVTLPIMNSASATNV